MAVAATGRILPSFAMRIGTTRALKEAIGLRATGAACAAFLAMLAGGPAAAQVICTPTPYVSGNLTCANTGATGGISTVATNGNANTTNSGFVSGLSGILTQATNGSATSNNSGTVNAGNAGLGTLATNGNATAINSGTINAGTFGIVTQTTGSGDASSTNTGTVSGGQFGIMTLAAGNASATNSGTVNGGVSGGIVTGALTGNAGTVNSGTVSSADVGIATSAQAGNASTINSGTVSGGTDGIATQASGNATTTNTGTVNGTNRGLFVLSLNGNATAINSGFVSAHGAGSVGVSMQAGGASTLVNSGIISNTGGTAIRFSGGADTLTLQPGSFIIGAIDLVGSNDTVHVNAGNLNLTFNTLAGATVSGAVPYVVNGNRIASVDPTSFGVADRTLMDFTRAISGLIEARVSEGSVQQGGAGAMGFASSGDAAARFDDAFAQVTGNAYAASDTVLFKAPTATTADGRTVWVRGFYGQRVQQAEGANLRSVTNFYGGAIGFDGLVQPDLRLGGLVGGGTTRMTVDLNSGGANADIVFGGTYGRYDIGAAFVDFALLGGHTQNNTVRNINNNLLANGLETATAGFGGWFVSPEIASGFRYGLGGGWTLTPALRLRYVAAEFGGFTETGSTANLSVGSRTLQNVEERGDLTLTRTSTFADAGQLRSSVHVGMIGLKRVGDGGVNTILLAQALAFATPGKSNVFGGYAGAGFDWRMRGGVSLFAAGEYTAMSDSSGTITGRGGVRVAF
jgi:hypothetical protein